MLRSICLSLAALSLTLPVSAQSMPEGNAAPAPMMSKMMVETPLKRVINPTYMAPARAAAQPPVFVEKSMGVDANGVQKVKPGAVNWQKDFKVACNAGEVSGRPVLMFAMIGKLDDKFC